MSHIIIPGQRPPRPTKRGGDYATINEAINIAHNVAGPIAVTLQQVMQKLARCEDRLGITDESIVGEEPPRGTPLQPVEGVEPLTPLTEDDPSFTVGPQFGSTQHGSPLVTDGDVE